MASWRLPHRRREVAHRRSTDPSRTTNCPSPGEVWWHGGEHLPTSPVAFCSRQSSFSLAPPPPLSYTATSRNTAQPRRLTSRNTAQPPGQGERVMALRSVRQSSSSGRSIRCSASGAGLGATTRIGCFSSDEPCTRPSQITSAEPTLTAGVLFVRTWHAPTADWRMLGFAPATLSIETRPSVGSVSCSCLREIHLSTRPRSSRPTAWVPGGREID